MTQCTVHRLSIPTMRMLLVVLICASIGAVAAHGQGDDWPMFGQNPRLTFSTNVTLHYPLRLKWSFVIPKEKKVPGPVALIMASRFPPVVSGGKVVVGGFNGKVHALNAVTGRVLWRRNLRGQVWERSVSPLGACILQPRTGAYTVWRFHRGRRYGRRG